ncbi:MAG: minor capsid protein [Raoultibacter sp.]|uniref:phage tail terminator protein n=1 Tax=Gordonibacter sp. TaxID=1968902 RepID=UPI0030462A9C
MIDVVDVAALKLKEAGYETSVKRLDELDSREGVVLRRLPATVTARYADLGQSVAYVFQAIVKRRDEERAIDDCEKITNLLVHADLASRNGSYVFTNAEVYTEPQELELNESGYFIWEARIRVNIYRKDLL